MKSQGTNGKQWDSSEAFDNNRVTHNKYVVNIPIKYLGYEQNILIKKMINYDSYNYRYSFADKRHEAIYNLIETFYKLYQWQGITTDNFINYAIDSKVLENCGGEKYIRAVFQNLEIEGVAV